MAMADRQIAISDVVASELLDMVQDQIRVKRALISLRHTTHGEAEYYALQVKILESIEAQLIPV